MVSLLRMKKVVAPKIGPWLLIRSSFRSIYPAIFDGLNLRASLYSVLSFLRDGQLKVLQHNDSKKEDLGIVLRPIGVCHMLDISRPHVAPHGSTYVAQSKRGATKSRAIYWP